MKLESEKPHFMRSEDSERLLDPNGGNGDGKETPPNPPKPNKIIKPYNRQIIFPAKRLESEAEVDAYVEKIRDHLKQLLKNCDGIQLK